MLVGYSSWARFPTGSDDVGFVARKFGKIAATMTGMPGRSRGKWYMKRMTLGPGFRDRCKS